MSILIKGMEMPKDCEECLFYEVDVENGCWLKKYFCVRRYGIDRPSWCPIVEIPPHGRLIDADALTGKAYMDGKLMCVEMDDIEEAPTIIEAEKET